MVPELTDGARGRGAEALGWQWLVDWFAVPRGRAAIAISTLTMEASRRGPVICQSACLPPVHGPCAGWVRAGWAGMTATYDDIQCRVENKYVIWHGLERERRQGQRREGGKTRGCARGYGDLFFFGWGGDAVMGAVGLFTTDRHDRGVDGARLGFGMVFADAGGW